MDNKTKAVKNRRCDQLAMIERKSSATIITAYVAELRDKGCLFDCYYLKTVNDYHQSNSLLPLRIAVLWLPKRLTCLMDCLFSAGA